MRSLLVLVLSAWLCQAGSVYADDSSDAQQAPEQTDAAAPTPVLQPSDNAPSACDPSATRFRFVEVRGTGFDAWATQRLVGSVVDADGHPQVQWGSVWVSPAGRLTLEVNLCADPFRGRPALPAGTYTVAVATSPGHSIAETSISVLEP